MYQRYAGSYVLAPMCKLVRQRLNVRVTGLSF